MLELEKKEFTNKMNFKVTIPNLLVKLSNTYYTKVSNFIKNFKNHSDNEKHHSSDIKCKSPKIDATISNF